MTPTLTTLAGANVGHSLKAGSSTNCDLRDPGTGEVEAKAVANPGSKSCTLVVTVSRTGYTSKTRDISIPLAAGSITGVAWSPTTNGNVGVDLNLEAVTGSADGDVVTYSKVSGAGCTLAGQVVSFTTTADCVVVATVARTGYTSWNSGNKTITVGKGTLDLTWNPGTATTQVSSSPLALSAVSGGDTSTAAITYSVTNAGLTNCEFEGGGGAGDHTLTFDTAGSCTVKATATRAHYNNWDSGTHTITITNNPPVGITWSGYGGGTNSVAMGSTYNPDTPTYTPSGASGSYSHTGSGCSVASDGTLTPQVAGDSCVVTLSATANNYEPGSTQQTVNVVKATQNAPGASDVYGSSPTLVTGGTLIVDTAPNGGHGTLTYQTTTTGICGVDQSSGTITAKLNGNCIVQAKWGGNATYQASAWGTVQTVTIGRGTLTITDAGSYSGPLVVGGASLTPGSPTTNPTGASFSYALKQGETDCTLDGSTGSAQGTVSAATVTVSPGVTACTVVVTATLTGYNPATAEISVDLQGAQLVFVTTAPPAYPSSGFPTDGGIEVGAIPSADDNTIAVTWSFVAVGSQKDGTAKSNVCSVDNTSSSATFGDVSAGTAAATGDVCTVTITATASTAGGYESWSREIVLKPGFLPVVEIASLYQHTCARFDDNRVKCWGKGDHAQLGTDDLNDKGDSDNEMGSHLSFVRRLVIVNGVSQTTILMAQQIAASWGHSCAVLVNGGVKCWGIGTAGQLGDGINRPSHYLTQPPSAAINLGANITASKISLGGTYSCALLNDATLKCWGDNTYGQLGYGNTTLVNAPKVSDPPAASDVVNVGLNKTVHQVLAGSYHTCAILNDGSVKCWGRNNYGQLGYGDTTERSAPPATATVNLGDDMTAIQLAAGQNHTCAILNDNSLKCWGLDDNGQVGDGSGNENCNTGWQGWRNPHPCRKSPTAVDLGQDAQSQARTAKFVAAGYSHTCAILNDDTVRCWGLGNHGRLGYDNASGLNAPSATAVNLGTGRIARSLVLGEKHTCALLDDDTVKCWGSNTNGALGAGGSVTNLGDGSGEMGDNLPIVELF